MAKKLQKYDLVGDYDLEMAPYGDDGEYYLVKDVDEKIEQLEKRIEELILRSLRS